MGRTNIVIDDRLIGQAMRLVDAKSKREAVDLALRRLVASALVYRAIRKMRGKFHWVGEAASWRGSRT